MDEFELKGGYRCNKCGVEVMIDCPLRRVAEPIQEYVHRLAAFFGEHHRTQHPRCAFDKLDLKLPVTQSGIGYPGEALTDEDRQDIERALQEPRP